MEDIQASFSQLQVSTLESELIQTFLNPIEEIIQGVQRILRATSFGLNMPNTPEVEGDSEEELEFLPMYL